VRKRAFWGAVVCDDECVLTATTKLGDGRSFQPKSRFSVKEKSVRHLLFVALLVLNAMAAGVSQAGELFDDKPYSLNMPLIQALDPKPLRYQAFSPDPADTDRVKGLRILSQGRIFPFVFEIISVQGAKPEVLESVSKSLEGKEDIVLKVFAPCPVSDRCLHYFQRFSENGKPHHVSANYLFMKNGAFFHFSASSYAATIMPRDSWGPPAADGNAELEASRLLKAATFKHAPDGVGESSK
jgi:hypothetical protein